MTGLIHGGQLAKIAAQYTIDMAQWLDLSTGIAPYHYPIGEIPMAAYQQLPQQSTELLTHAADYYNYHSLMATNGSQAIIKMLPELWQQRMPQSRDVFLPEHGYKEHQLAWRQANYAINHYQTTLPSIESLTPNCVLVIINPNNPTGQLFSQQELVKYQQALDQVNGLLVVDEAFMDVIEPTQSIGNMIGRPDISNTVSNTISNTGSNIIVLRSFGKFFGLAGVRIGFVLASEQWISAFEKIIGPWQVNGPAQHIAQQAFGDKTWQQQQRQRLSKASAQMNQRLHHHFSHDNVVSIVGTDLFQTVNFNDDKTAPQIHHLLCQQAIYVRLCDDQKSLRFGIATPEQLPVLDKGLSSVLNLLKAN